MIDTASGQVVQRVKIGKNPEYVRVHNGYAYVTYEPGEDGGPPPAGNAPNNKPGADDDADKLPAEIAIVDMKTWHVIRSVTSGHETEGIEFSRDGNMMLVTNEGDDTVSVYHARTGAPIRTVKLAAGGRPRGIRLSPDGRVVSDQEWAAKKDTWLPTAEDRAFVASLMGRVVETSKFANWIAPPVMGINRQPVDFDYVRFD